MIKLFKSFTTAAFFVLLAFASTLFAQGRASETNTIVGNEEIRGTVKYPPGDVSGGVATVTLRSLSSPEIKGTTNPDGEFRFTHLRPDSYTVIVDAGAAYEKATETVSVGFSGSVPAQGNPFSHAYPVVYPVLIYLRPKGLDTAADSSAAAVPTAAKKHFHRALEAQRAGNHQRAIENLKAVIKATPSFTLAYRELGAEYLRTGEGQLALDTLRDALKIAPDDPALLLNYGVALLHQKQFAAAETELRHSIEKGKGYSLAANYYLGVALIGGHKIGDARAVLEDVVKNGGDKLPLVHRYLGGIYLQDKQYAKAADELSTYLKLDPKAADADKIRETIKESRSKIS